MEEKSPTQRQDVPRSRSPRAAFSTPEQAAPDEEPTKGAPRRPAKAAPPVTFQPPASESAAEPQPGRHRKTAGSTPETPPAEDARSTENTSPSKPAEPEKRPTKAPALPAKAPAKKAAPVKRSPRKAPAPRATTSSAAPNPTPPTVTDAQSESITTMPTTTDAGSETVEPPATAPGRPGAVESAPPSVPTESPTPADKASVDVPAANDRIEAWAKIVADPGHSPELLALAAVQTIGPRAKEWAARISDAYPSATSAGKARLAVRQFTRFGGLSTVCAAVAGSYAPVALLGTAALTQADLVLHIAAAYGLDPTEERRAADLLVLTRVHPSRADAQAAIDTAKQPSYEDEDGGISDAAWRLGRMVAAQAGRWTAIRTLNRFFPGTSLLAAVLTSRSGAQALAERAERFYSQESQAFGSSV
jgi:hypothetical protein